MQKKQHGKLYLFMGVLLAIVAVLGIFFKSVQPENEAHKEAVRMEKKYAHLKKEDAFYEYYVMLETGKIKSFMEHELLAL